MLLGPSIPHCAPPAGVNVNLQNRLQIRLEWALDYVATALAYRFQGDAAKIEGVSQLIIDRKCVPRFVGSIRSFWHRFRRYPAGTDRPGFEQPTGG